MALGRVEVGARPRRRWRPPPSAMEPAPVGEGTRHRRRWRPPPSAYYGRHPPPSALAPALVGVGARQRRRWRPSPSAMVPALEGVGARHRRRWRPPPSAMVHALTHFGVGARQLWRWHLPQAALTLGRVEVSPGRIGVQLLAPATRPFRRWRPAALALAPGSVGLGALPR